MQVENKQEMIEAVRETDERKIAPPLLSEMHPSKTVSVIETLPRTDET
jgi:hypothetical protein